MSEDSSDKHSALAVTISIEALKALLIANGGAATAFIALTGKDPKGPNYSLAILLFGAAALLNAATLVVGYFSQLAYANHRLAHEQLNESEANDKFVVHGQLQRIAITIAAGSLIESVAGMFCAFRAL